MFWGVKTFLLCYFVCKSSHDAFSLQLLFDSAQVVSIRIPKTVEAENAHVLNITIIS